MRGCERSGMQRQKHGEPRWHAALAVLAAILLYVTLPPRLIVGPLWLFPLLVLAIMVPLNILSPRRYQESRAHRAFSVATIAI